MRGVARQSKEYDHYLCYSEMTENLGQYAKQNVYYVSNTSRLRIQTPQPNREKQHLTTVKVGTSCGKVTSGEMEH